MQVKRTSKAMVISHALSSFSLLLIGEPLPTRFNR
ncbi:UNVERIFIED_ORG: hypothetical protein J2W85_004125 [Ensifer adhaerens]|nr:hypothetical protein [Ensifer adhaerens]